MKRFLIRYYPDCFADSFIMTSCEIKAIDEEDMIDKFQAIYGQDRLYYDHIELFAYE